jgi:CheY-like chemotaxis protein
MAAQYPLRVLLAEDNNTNVKMMTMIMRKLGYSILIAADGEEVLRVMEREAAKGSECEVQCILMDVSMNGMVSRQQQQQQQQQQHTCARENTEV